MTRRTWGAVAVIAGALLTGLGSVDLFGSGLPQTSSTTLAVDVTTTTSLPIVESTTTSTRATTTTSQLDSGAVEMFAEEYRLALESDNLTVLFDGLHPRVRESYGEDLCREWIAREISQLTNYQLTGPLIGPSSATIATNGGTFEVHGLYTGPIRFTYQGTEFEGQAQFAVEEDSIYWLGICR